MNTKKALSTLVALGGVALATSNAWAGICQVYSTTFLEKKTCGLTSRGYAQGRTEFGQRALVTKATGSSRSVGARGIYSNGALSSGCVSIDWNGDAFESFSIGGECNSVAKFGMQVTY